MTPHHETAIIGSGFAGLGFAIRLKQSGIEDFVVLERADTLGGTWRDNSYPGCACDVPAPLYSFSFAPNPGWSTMYAGYAEIRAYMEDCADRFNVRSHIRFRANMTGAEWDEQRQVWHIEIDGERAMTARMLIGGLGGLNKPAYPEIEGRETFAGSTFHTADWDHDVDLSGKRVAVIGTGASAIQLIPRAARVAERVDVFMRTPPWVLPKAEFSFSKSVRQSFKRLPILQKLLRGTIFALTESLAYPITKNQKFLRLLEKSGRRHLRARIDDPDLRRDLKPSYRLGCKRILMANDFYPALNRENVDVITDGISRITERGVVTADGAEHEADVIVYATGFAIEDVFKSLALRGRDGVDLRDVWADGVEAHRGTAISGFPNFMMLGGPNTGTGSTSQIYMMEAQMRYLLRAMKLMRARGIASIEPRVAAQRAYNNSIQSRMENTVWITGGCNSWYLDSTGKNRVLYPGFSSQFSRSLREFREHEYILEPIRRIAPVSAAA